MGSVADSAVRPSTRLGAPLKLDDFEPAARKVLPPGIYDYIAGGSEDEATLQANPEAFAPYRFRFKVLAFADRAVDAGFPAIVLPRDLPQPGRRERDIRNAFSLPEGLRYANLDGKRGAATAEGPDPFAQNVNAHTNPALSWADLEWLVAKSPLPVIVKGLVRADDARHAVEAGARGLVVSNHGGRQLDYSIASLDALPEVVEAVGGRVPVLLDGGVRRGTDVLKALSLGAAGVLVGRPYLWALAVGGAEGVSGMLAMLRQEIEVSMSLLGVGRLSELNPDLVTRI